MLLLLITETNVVLKFFQDKIEQQCIKYNQNLKSAS